MIRASDGQVTQCVRIGDTAYHTGAVSFPFNNSRSLGVEHEVTVTNPDQWNSVPLLTASTALANYFSTQYGIPKTRTLPGIRGHSEMPGTSTQCPGPLPWTTWMTLLAGGGVQNCGLAVGGGVRVRFIDGTPLRVRSCAGLSCSQIGSKPEGSTGVIQSGPTDADGYRWWQIRWDGDNLVGWSAQGEGNVCWLEPFAPAPTSTPTRTWTPSFTATPSFTWTPVPTHTWTPTATYTPTPLPTSSPTFTPSESPSPTATRTEEPTPTNTEGGLVPHPADANGDFRISIGEAATRLLCWREAQPECSIGTTAVALALWRGGECYQPMGNEYQSVPCAKQRVQTGSADRSGEGTLPSASRTLPPCYRAGAPVAVSVSLSFPNGPPVVALLEEEPPAGWEVDVQSVSHNGAFSGGKVRWSFVEGLAIHPPPAAVGYTATPPVGGSGVVSFSGTLASPSESAVGGASVLSDECPSGTESLRTLPPCYCPGESFSVSIDLAFSEPPPEVVLLEDTLPTGWTVSSISDSGVFSQGKVRWSFVQDLGVYPPPPFVTYEAVPDGSGGAVFFSGTLATPEESLVGGVASLGECIDCGPTHTPTASPTPHTTPTELVGDLDGDGSVGPLDLLRFLQNWKRGEE